MSHCVDEWVFEKSSIQLFPLITHILAACKDAHTYRGHKWDCALSSSQQRISSHYFINYFLWINNSAFGNMACGIIMLLSMEFFFHNIWVILFLLFHFLIHKLINIWFHPLIFSLPPLRFPSCVDLISATQETWPAIKTYCTFSHFIISGPLMFSPSSETLLWWWRGKSGEHWGEKRTD